MSEPNAISSSVHVVRHGEVHNPESILYGRQPGWRLSERGLAMAEAVANWSKDLSLGAIHSSPLERAQQTATPISIAHGISIKSDDRLIEAANIFEGKPFGVGDGVLRQPKAWRHLWNPWRPSWGEPYKEQIARMKAAVEAARISASGKDALVVSHQLPIWILRSSIEGRSLLHDPRRRQCSLASVTSFHFDASGRVVGLTYTEPAKHLLPVKR
ncbi:MAG: histidine phosphatase family protein [Candidatus Nanopelagicaceae bacterium]